MGDISSDEEQELGVDEVEEDIVVILPPPKKPDPIALHFEVPVSGGLRDIHVTSETLHSEVLHQIAETMGIRTVEMRIGYIFSFMPKSPKPIPKFFDTVDVEIRSVLRIMNTNKK